MGVWVFSNYVKNENGIVSAVNDINGPRVDELIFLGDLVYIEELREALFDMAGKEIDLSFFQKPYAPDYGDETNKNVSFKPSEVLECIDQIKVALENNGERIIREYKISGKSESIQSLVISELENLRGQSVYAMHNNYELQITLS